MGKIDKIENFESYLLFPPGSSSEGSPNRQILLRGFAIGLLVVGALSGCVHRRLTIRTDPPGAMAYVDGYPIGTTPISTDFIYYGTREIRIVKDGYETVVAKQRFWPPWYEIPPLDFISENLVPGELRDHRIVEFRLQPQRITPPEQLVDRAERLRRGEIFLSGTPSGLSGEGPSPSSPSPAALPPRLTPPGRTSTTPLLNPPPEPPHWTPAETTPPFSPGSSQPNLGGRPVYPLPGTDDHLRP